MNPNNVSNSKQMADDDDGTSERGGSASNPIMVLQRREKVARSLAAVMAV